MQEYNENRFNTAIERIREKCIKSPRSLRARLLNTLINKVGKVYNKEIHTVQKCQDREDNIRKKAVAPTDEEWDSLENRRGYNRKQTSIIDIICPVYRGYDETLRCIYSVLHAKTDVKYEFIVINDKSPDDKLTEKLRELSKIFEFTYIENEVNKGFLQSTNIGMQLHEERDVVWLNSDTEVFDLWLDRLVEVANYDKKIGTVTPISNNATIASYPRFVFDNSGELEISDYQINEICTKINRLTSVSAPTGIGFCMFVRREALKIVGLLDEIFNKGYGEENDLCQRLIKAGYRNVLTGATYIRHYGSVSFKEASLGFCKENTIILNRKHPNYASDVTEWVGLDPIKPVRVRIDAARLYNDWCLNHQTEPKEVVLHLSHNRGGGTQKFINELMHELESKGIASFNIYPLSNNSCTLRSHLLNIPNLDIIKYSSGIDEVKALIEGLHITKIHIHSLVDWNLIISDVLLDIAEKLGIQIFISVHDYHWCCSKINLMPNDRDCCIDLSKKSCFACDKNNMISTYEIRLKARMLFSKAKKVIFPNEDVLQRYSDVFKIDNYKVIPHIESYDHIRLNKSDNGSNFNICVIGNISVPKGSKVIQRLESYIIENNIKSTITIIGKTDIKINGVKYSGIYKNFEELSYKVKQIAPSIIFIPSIVPETYSYVLSEALALGVPVATFNIGAQANRMKGLGLAKNLIDLDLKDYPEKLYCSLVKITKNQCLQSFTDFSENSNDVLEYYI